MTARCDWGEIEIALAIARTWPAGEWDTSLWDEAEWEQTDTALGDWLDLTCDAIDGLTLAAGSNASDGVVRRWESSTCRVQFLGEQYDPRVGPWAGLLGPGLPVRVRWRPLLGQRARTVDPLAEDPWSVVFTGSVLNNGYEWEPSTRTATLVCTDRTSDLVSVDVEPVDPPVGDGDLASPRIDRLATVAQWPADARDLKAGGVPLIATTLSGTVWAQMLNVADSDLGLIWVRRDGRLSYRPQGRVAENVRVNACLVACPDEVRTAVNLLAADAATFEGSTGGWVPGTGTTIAQSAAHVREGASALALNRATAGDGSAATSRPPVVAANVLASDQTASGEDGTTTGWIGTGITNVADADDGARSFRQTTTTAGPYMQNGVFATAAPVTPGEWITVLASFKAEAAGRQAYLGIVWWNAAGAATFSWGSLYDVGTTWTRLARYWAVPADTVRASLALSPRGMATDGVEGMRMDRVGLFHGVVNPADWSLPSAAAAPAPIPVTPGEALTAMASVYDTAGRVGELAVTWVGGGPQSSNALVRTDGTFEDGTTDGWSQTVGTIFLVNSADVAHSGTRSLKVERTVNGSLNAINPGSAPRIPVTPGESVAPSLWARSPALTMTGAQVRMRIFDGSGAVIATLVGPTTTLVPNVWTWLSATFAIPAGAVEATVEFQTANTPVAGDRAYLDDVYLVRGSVPWNNRTPAPIVLGRSVAPFQAAAGVWSDLAATWTVPAYATGAILSITVAGMGAGETAYVDRAGLFEGAWTANQWRPPGYVPQTPIGYVDLLHADPTVLRNWVTVAGKNPPKPKGDTTPDLPDRPVVVLVDGRSVSRFRPQTYRDVDLEHKDDAWSHTIAEAVIADGAWLSTAPQSVDLDTRTHDQATEIATVLLGVEPEYVFDVEDPLDRSTRWRVVAAGWDVDVTVASVAGSIFLDDVTGWGTAAGWDDPPPHGWDVDTWSLVLPVTPAVTLPAPAPALELAEASAPPPDPVEEAPVLAADVT